MTGTTWPNVFAAMWGQAPRGTDKTEGTNVPKWTCREAVAVCWALGRTGSLPGWYQYAAIGYGWAPGGELNATEAQGDAVYPPYAEVLLRAETQRMTVDLEQRKPKDPNLIIDDVFDLPDVQASVLTSLRSETQFKIPLPACRGKNGKPQMPVFEDGKLKCPGGIVQIDDPLTASLKSFAKIAIPVGIAYLVFQAMSGKRRRRE